jgi:hypothetical protein
MRLGTIGRQSTQMGGDLFGTPLQVERCLDFCLQLGIRSELDAAWRPGSFAGAVVGQIGVVHAVIVREAVAAQFRG